MKVGTIHFSETYINLLWNIWHDILADVFNHTFVRSGLVVELLKQFLSTRS